MNAFTHTHSFENPGSDTCGIMYHEIFGECWSVTPT